MEYISVSMTPEDAELFVKFRQFQSAFEQLQEAGIADMKNGSVTLHYDKFGVIRNVEVIRNYYR